MTNHILIVDDDPGIRAMITDVLEFEGYDVETAANGAEALEAIDENPPSAMVLDMRMPVLDGWALARNLHERGKRVPTVVMSVWDEARRWSHEIAADAWLTKPFNLSDLLSTLERVRAP